MTGPSSCAKRPSTRMANRILVAGYSSGAMQRRHSAGGEVAGNAAPGESGGGIFSFGLLTATGVSIAHNSGMTGGGLGFDGPATLANDAVTDNTAEHRGRPLCECVVDAYKYDGGRKHRHRTRRPRGRHRVSGRALHPSQGRRERGRARQLCSVRRRCLPVRRISIFRDGAGSRAPRSPKTALSNLNSEVDFTSRATSEPSCATSLSPRIQPVTWAAREATSTPKRPPA